MRRIGCMSVSIAVLMSSGCAWLEERQFVSQVRNTPAPDFELSALDGGKVRLSGLRGKPVLLAFWSST